MIEYFSILGMQYSFSILGVCTHCRRSFEYRNDWFSTVLTDNFSEKEETLGEALSL